MSTHSPLLRPATWVAERPPDSTLCPLCGRGNGCGRAVDAAGPFRCWCQRVRIPEELVERIPHPLRGRACICRHCVEDYYRERDDRTPETAGVGDFYVLPDGNLVFTARYLWRRGYCCDQGCRHCPYQK